MEWVNLVIALVGAVTGTIALVWNVMKDLRRLDVIFLGQHILLLNHTRRPVNIDSVGFIFSDQTSQSITELQFKKLGVIPAEDQLDIEVGLPLVDKIIKYVFAQDVLGKIYRRRVKRADLEYWRTQYQSTQFRDPPKVNNPAGK